MSSVPVLLSPKEKVPMAALAALRIWKSAVTASLDLKSSTAQDISLIMPDG